MGPEDRAAAVALVTAVGNISQVWSYIHADTAKPRYVLAMSVNSASALGCILLSLFLRKVVQHVNRNIESGTNVAPVMKGEVSRLRDCLKS